VFQLQQNIAFYVASCILLNISTASSPKVVLSGVTVQGNSQIWSMVNGALPPGASLTVLDLNVDWVTFRQLPSPLYLIYVWSNTTSNDYKTSPICTDLDYSAWPQVIVSNVRVDNGSSLGFGVIPGLIQATDVAVSISQVVWLSPVYQLVQIQTSCFDSSFGLPDTTYQDVYKIPPISISMLSASSFVYYGAWLLGLAGGQITLTGFAISNVSQHSKLQSTGLVYVAPLSNFIFTNSRFSALGNVLAPTSIMIDIWRCRILSD